MVAINLCGKNWTQTVFFFMALSILIIIFATVCLQSSTIGARPGRIVVLVELMVRLHFSKVHYDCWLHTATLAAMSLASLLCCSLCCDRTREAYVMMSRNRGDTRTAECVVLLCRGEDGCTLTLYFRDRENHSCLRDWVCDWHLQCVFFQLLQIVGDLILRRLW